MRNFDALCSDFSNVSLLARAGQKIVYRACHPKFGDVVIKLYYRLDDPRAEREISIGLRPDLNAVPTIFDTGRIVYEGAETLFVIEQKIDGEDLRKKLNRDERFNLSQSVEFLEQGLEFIAMLEKLGIVHRDIKPENIILTPQFRVFFIDFGIARFLDQPSITQTEAVLGPHTPGYAAPEQFNNIKRDIDSRADLFSLGVVTYECITGCNPFREGASSPLDILQKTETITPVAHIIQGDTQQQFMALLSSMMGKYPSRRPKNANQALGWLNAAKPTFCA